MSNGDQNARGKWAEQSRENRKKFRGLLWSTSMSKCHILVWLLKSGPKKGGEKSIIALLVLGLTQHRLSALQKTKRSKYNTYSKMRWTVLVTDILHQQCYTGEHLSRCLTTHLNALHCTVCLFIFSGGCKVVMKKWTCSTADIWSCQTQDWWVLAQ